MKIVQLGQERQGIDPLHGHGRTTYAFFGKKNHHIVFFPNHSLESLEICLQISLANFLEACLRTTQPLQPVDVVACKVAMRELASELKHTYKAIRVFQRLADQTASSSGEYRIVSEDHPAVLDIAKSKIEAHNKELEAQLFALKSLEKEYLEGDMPSESEWAEFHYKRNCVLASGNIKQT